MIRIICLGDEPRDDELRIGAVQRVPIRKPKGSKFALWLPEMAPSEELRQAFRRGAGLSMREFLRRFKAEMRALERKHLIRFVAELSRKLPIDVAVGCYCRDEHECHRSVLRELLAKEGVEVRGAKRGR